MLQKYGYCNSIIEFYLLKIINNILFKMNNK